MDDKSFTKPSIDPQEMLGIIKQLNFTIDKLKEKISEPIAIIGMGCRFPGGANSPLDYWQLLLNGTDGISEVPADRWKIKEYYDPDPDVPGKMYCKWGGFLNIPVQDFDANFFSINPLEARMIDPQQRLALEVVWEALENANIISSDLKGTSCGVFMGVSTDDYADIVKNGTAITAYTNSGLGRSVLAGRISYELGLQGPSLVLDTACSSSLVAIHQACTSLRKGESNLAIAGGVNLMLTPDATIGFCKSRFLAVDGRCKAFDESANGYVRGEGCGVIILKRLSDAKKDGNHILAVIKGSAVNQDGASGGLTVPNGPAQEAVITQALKDAGVGPNEISYIEAHGTGTSLGDPIEVNALEQVLKIGRLKEQELIISSVKTNIGHLEAAAGMASIIKVILAIQNEQIPKHLHFNKLNPNIVIDENVKLTIPTENIKWQRGERRRIAGISGFAFQGTNAHIIIEESPQVTSDVEKNQNQLDMPLHILAISAKNTDALKDLSKSYMNMLNRNNNLPNYFANLSFSANRFRSHFNQRLSIVGSDALDAKNKLQEWLQTGKAIGVIKGETTSQDNPKIAFLFTGQGSQYAGMGKDLYLSSPIFKNAIEECADILEQNNYLDINLLSLLWGNDSQYLDDTKYTQPALFALEYALYQLWLSWGIIPSAVIGHSVGEYVAATVAGVFSLEDGLKIISKRAVLMQSLPQNGAMAMINASESEIAKALLDLNSVVSVAAINSPTSVVVSGDSQNIKEIIAYFDKKSIRTSILKVSHAFHSHLMEPILAELKKFFKKLNTPIIPLISNVTGNQADKKISTIDYWVNHTRCTVKFADGVRTLFKTKFNCFVEVGPHPVLLAMAKECQEDEQDVCI